MPTMTPSRIVRCTTAPADGPWRVIGAVDGAAIVHVQPGGDLPAGAELVYDPTPARFSWEAFAVAHPEIAAACTPHGWLGEDAA